MDVRFFVIVFALVWLASVEAEDGELPIVGVNTHNKYTVTKDSIITRNLKVQDKKQAKKIDVQKEELPDWSYEGIPDEVKTYAESFKKNMTECLKEIHPSDGNQIQRLSPNPESFIHGECLIACVFKRNKVILDGKVDKEHLLLLVSKFYGKDYKFMKKLEKNVDRCITSVRMIKDECEMAGQLNSCTNGIMQHKKHPIDIDF